MTARMRNWSRLVGETGDLADVVVATLSLASMNHKLLRLDLDQFYDVFSSLQKDFPKLIPELHATRLNGYVYSKPLGDALENALRLGVQIANPRFQYLEVPEDRAQKMLEGLRVRAGDEFVTSLAEVADELATRVSQSSPAHP